MVEDRILQRTILLLGGTRFVGQNLAAELARAGHRVIVGGGQAKHMSSVPLAFGMPLTLPLAATDAIISLVRKEGIQTVVHMASAMKPSSSLSDYAKEQSEIALPTMQLGTRLADLGVELIFLSSGGTVYGKVSGPLASETDICAPINYYGRSKLGIESDLQFLERTSGLRFLTLRISNPFGRYQDLRGGQGFVSVALGKVIDKKPLEVWGDGKTVRDYIYIDDLVCSIRGLIDSNVRGVTLNIGSGLGHSLLEVVDMIRTVTGHTLDVKFNPARAVDVPRLVLDVERLRDLGLYYSRSLKSGIKAYAAELGVANG